MANFGQLILTNLGLQAQVGAQSGGELKFKRIAMGSGAFDGNAATLTKLVKENVSLPISYGYIQNNAYTVEGFFSNEDLLTGFEWREVGVYIEGSDGGEILYCYANAGEAYDYIPATEDERYSKYIRVAMVVGNTTNVSIVESEGIIYVDKRTFDDTVERIDLAVGDLDDLQTKAKNNLVAAINELFGGKLNADFSNVTDRKTALDKVAYLGGNAVASTSEDTFAKWTAIGTGYSFYSSTGLINGQPSQYGVLMNIVVNSNLTQLWFTLPQGTMYYRGGNSSGLATSWTKILSSGNIGDTLLDSLGGTLSISKGGTGKGTAAEGFTVLARRPGVGSSNLVNADTLTTPGIHQVYFEGSTYNPADYNYPYAYGVLIVESTVSYVGQLFFAVSANKLWYRTRATTSSNWGSWCKVYDTNNKPTLDDLGAAAASTHNIKTYNNLSQLGLANGATMSQVARALPGSSMLRIYVLTSENSKLAPSTTNGWLEVSRPSANHVEFRYTTTSRMTYCAVVLNVNTDNEQVSEWTKVALDDDLADYLPLAGGTVSGAATPLTLNNKDGGDVWLGFQNKGAFLGYIGITSGGIARVLLGGAYYNLYHEGNKPTPAGIGAAASSHTQAASTITAGTFGGVVYANRNSGNQAAGQYLVRNSKLVTAEENPTYEGEICWTYE